MKLKPFNLERALASDPVVLGNGTKVLEIFVSKIVDEYCVIAVDEKRRIGTYTKQGRYKCSLDDCTKLDLFMVPKTQTYWANVYKDEAGNLLMSPIAFESEESAKKFMDTLHSSLTFLKTVTYIKTISFEVEE